LPNGGTKPVVVSDTTPFQGGNCVSSVTKQLHFLKEGTLRGGEEIKPGILHGGEEIRPGVLHVKNYAPATYRTKDGSGVFKFRFVDLGGKYEIDIESQPSYGSRNSSSTASHRLPSARGGQKICIAVGKEPKTIESAKKICMEWAELTKTYCDTGKSINSQVASNANPVNRIWQSIIN